MVAPYVRKAQYHETDQMGIIHHANFIKWFEEARVDHMEKMGLGYDVVEKRGIFLPLTGLSCEYKNMVRFAERVFISCELLLPGPARAVVRYQITGEAGEVKATGETHHCFLSATGRPVALKKADPELYALFAAAAVQK